MLLEKDVYHEAQQNALQEKFFSCIKLRKSFYSANRLIVAVSFESYPFKFYGGFSRSPKTFFQKFLILNNTNFIVSEQFSIMML